MMRGEDETDHLIDLLAESLIEASDEDILRIAAARNIDVEALSARIQRLIEVRIFEQ